MKRMTSTIYSAMRSRITSRQVDGRWEHVFNNDGLNEGIGFLDERYIDRLRMVSDRPFCRSVARRFFSYQANHADFVSRLLLCADSPSRSCKPLTALCAAALLAGFFGLQAVSESALPLWEGVGAIALILALEIPVVKTLNRIA